MTTTPGTAKATMPNSLIRWRLRTNTTLRERVASTAAKVAQDVANEDQSTVYHWERDLLAEKVLDDPMSTVDYFMPAVAANPTVLSSTAVTGPRTPGMDAELDTSAVTDDDIEFILTGIWTPTARRVIGAAFQGRRG